GAEPPSPGLNGLDKINNDESSKLRTFLSILRSLIWMIRFVGVPDIASVRFSLPAQLLEPTPNLVTGISIVRESSVFTKLMPAFMFRILELSGSTGNLSQVRAITTLRSQMLFYSVAAS
ncbi:hypothetical protein Egran_04517, partial [Elaphomyces granulatus]